ncbi:MAG: MFS transporter, partial [Actinomycetota bacterium]|nr:MFS transporter [Actinomycetota bacterium]
MVAGGAALTPLWEARYRRVFIAQTISYMGSAATTVALSFAVLDLTHSTTALGVVNAAGAVPLVALVLLGGVLGDRIHRGRLLVGSNLVLAVTQASMAMLVLTHDGSTWSLAACAAVGGLANAAFLPALQGVIPHTVSHEFLGQANAMLRLTRNGIQIFGG